MEVEDEDDDDDLEAMMRKYREKEEMVRSRWLLFLMVPTR